MRFKTSIARTPKVLRAALAATVALGGLPLVAAAQEQSAPSAASGPNQGWFKACTKQEDNDICVVQNIITAPTGQLLTATGLILVEGKVNRQILQVSVPSARMIPPGVQMQIDGGQAQRLEYTVCMPEKCVAEVPLTEALVNAFKRGGEVVFTSVNFQRAPNPIKMSLSGFTAAFDGEPIKQSELEERQRLLQEEMQKKAEEARRKLEEAQDAAKAQ